MTNLFVLKPRRRADRVAHRKLAIIGMSWRCCQNSESG